MSASTQMLALNPAESGYERLKVNASKALTVDNSAVTQPVSGTFYQATQPVSVAGSLVVDGSAVTQPVSGAFYPVTQPVSVAGSLVVDGSAVTQPVSGTFYQATQPISGSVSVTGNVATVAGATSVSNSSQFSSEVITTATSAQSAGLDISAVGSCLIYGDTDNLSEEVDIEISFDNTNWYKTNLSLYPDPTSGNIVKELISSAKYVRINKHNNSGSSETITLSIMTKE